MRTLRNEVINSKCTVNKLSSSEENKTSTEGEFLTNSNGFDAVLDMWGSHPLNSLKSLTRYDEW